MSSSTESSRASSKAFKACVEPHQGSADVDWLHARMTEFKAQASRGLDHKPLAVSGASALQRIAMNEADQLTQGSPFFA
ncbi:MAG: hypothetical protein QE570_16710 [Verrucomicrobiota bacterium]|jgi:hypothetical protein|nr:hypothetical protein [Verrucomicrobiota bacterium]